MAKPGLEQLDWRVWRMVDQTHARFKNCLDQIVAEQGLTSEQHAVLVAVKYLDAPVRITDIARWLGRSTNSVSMLADRMVKAGLVRRVRDRSDRRVVNVIITSKGEKAFGPADAAARKFVQQIMSALTNEDKHASVSLIKMIDRSILAYLNPGADIEKVFENGHGRHDKVMKRWLK